MKRRHTLARPCWMIPLGVLLVPPLAWTLVLSLLPTGWARARVAARLEAASGRPVRLETLRVGAIGGLYLGGLEVASPVSPADPWLKAETARIDVSLVQLLCGRVDPTDLLVDGLTLRVLRRADGAFEPAESGPPRVSSPAAGAGGACEPPALGFRFTNARLTVVDEPSGARLELTGVEGQGTWEGRRLILRESRGTLNGGDVELAAQLDLSGTAPAFEGQLRARRVGLGRGMDLLGYLAPVLAAGGEGLEGRLDLNAFVRGSGTGREDLRRTLVGGGALTLDPVRLDRSPLLDALADVVEIPPANRVGSVTSGFTIEGGRVATQNLTIDLARLPFVLSGWTDFDGRVDYRLSTDRLADRLPAKARDVLAELQVDPFGRDPVRILGSVAHPSIILNGRPLQSLAGPEGRQKVRDLTRKLRDRVLR